jgi:hypothetical protein
MRLQIYKLGLQICKKMQTEFASLQTGLQICELRPAGASTRRITSLLLLVTRQTTKTQAKKANEGLIS